ncbi:CD97 antigen [Platysternon megacephalum]|uniref:CD97 antigen n=1 Tax=Platysternon megacephalum TaxID=55544 RepID=A0A4D9DS41_9SAUR|nr:CD97 antigen [Platysternon megacephalum]
MGNLSYLFSVDPDHVKCTQQNQSRCWLAEFTSSVVLKINLWVHNYAGLEPGATEVNGSSAIDFNRHRTTATFSGAAVGVCTKLKGTLHKHRPLCMYAEAHLCVLKRLSAGAKHLGAQFFADMCSCKCVALNFQRDGPKALK